MSPLFIALGALLFYFIAYHTYGRWLGQKLFRLSAKNLTPAYELEDGTDYVPTPKGIVFGHHFTSIAGTGPIVGPAVAVIWGWVPALLWVLLGSVLIGAVHDFGALVVSLRNRGQTIGDIAGKVLSLRTRLLFLSLLFVALTIVLAIFGLVIAGVFKMFPSSISPCLLQIPLAIGVGFLFRKTKVGILIPSLLTLGLMYLSIVFGTHSFLGEINTTLSELSLVWWVGLLLFYSYIASVLPVWSLLQPRDYINSLQLIATLGLIVLGLLAASFWGLQTGGHHQEMKMVAPAFQWSPEGAPSIFPFLFITIACGAISGFHCLVSSGTSSKQIKNECDAQFIGYGSMLTEGFLAVLVILACVAGIGLGSASVSDPSLILYGESAFLDRYASWGNLAGLGPKVGAFVTGSANFLKALGIPPDLAVPLMGVFVASFAATTLDSACRLQRYVVQELAGTLYKHQPVVAPHTGIQLTMNPLSWLTRKHGATLFAILMAGMLAYLPDSGSGKGGMLLWPLFGATNQLLGGLAFLVIIFWLRRRGLPTWFLLFPAALMLVLPAVAMTMNVATFWSEQNWLLFSLGVMTLLLELWILIEAFLAWPRVKDEIESPLRKRKPPTPTV